MTPDLGSGFSTTTLAPAVHDAHDRALRQVMQSKHSAPQQGQSNGKIRIVILEYCSSVGFHAVGCEERRSR